MMSSWSLISPRHSVSKSFHGEVLCIFLSHNSENEAKLENTNTFKIGLLFLGGFVVGLYVQKGISQINLYANSRARQLSGSTV